MRKPTYPSSAFWFNGFSNKGYGSEKQTFIHKEKCIIKTHQIFERECPRENKTDSENKRKHKNPIWFSQKSITGHNILYVKESNKEMQKEFLKMKYILEK